MNIRDLKEIIGEAEMEGADDETEVRYAHQPSWAFEYSINDADSKVVDVNKEAAPDPQDYEEDLEYDVAYTKWLQESSQDPEYILYLVEGRQLDYLPGVVSAEIGW